jgi:DNA repair protein RadA/Sms
LAKARTVYVCQACGTTHGRWSGQCAACDEWNTIAEEPVLQAVPKGNAAARSLAGGRLDVVPLQGEDEPLQRLVTGIKEFDHVCGSGMVPGGCLLIGGDPGIGKSTLLLQVAARAAAVSGKRTLYVSGEEGVAQVRLRAARLGLADAAVDLASATQVGAITAAMNGEHGMVVIDSIQTMAVEALESAPGTVSQVKAAAHELNMAAKKHSMPLVLVGHVTKDGSIAGPRVLEHMVDTVLYFEGDRSHQYRILRSVKNRFGPTDEIGVFEMTGLGLTEVPNPSALFLGSRDAEGAAVSGSAVFAGIEGTRPLLVEIQALVGQAGNATPRRTAVGWDSARLAMVIAVLETRCLYDFQGRDVYLNVAGGLRLSEPAADMAAAAALVSALIDKPVPRDVVLFGEIGLSGELRPVGQEAARLREAERLGFSRALAALTPSGGKGKVAAAKGLAPIGLSRLSDLAEWLREGG